MTCMFSIKKVVVIIGLIVFIKSHWLESWHCYAGFEKDTWDSFPETITLEKKEGKEDKFYGVSRIRNLLEHEGEGEGRSTTGGGNTYKLPPVMNQEWVKCLLCNAYKEKRDFVFVEFLPDTSRGGSFLTKGFLVKCEDFKLVSFHDIIACSSGADNKKDKAYNPSIILFKKDDEAIEFSIPSEGDEEDIVSLVEFVEAIEGVTQEEGVLPSYDFHTLQLHQPILSLYDYFISYDKTTGLGVCIKDLCYARKSDSDFQTLTDHITTVANESKGRAIACIDAYFFREKIVILEALLDDAEEYKIGDGLLERFDKRIRFDECVIRMIEQINGQVNELVMLPQPEEDELLKRKEGVEKRIVKFFDRCMDGQVDHLCSRFSSTSQGSDKSFDDFVEIITEVNEKISEPMSDILNKILLKIVGAGERYEHIDSLKKWVESLSDNSVQFSELSLGGEAGATGGRGTEQVVGEIAECDKAAKIINGGKKNVKVIENYLNRLNSLAGKKCQLESPLIHKQALDNVDMILRGCVEDVEDDYTLECLLVEAIVDSRLPSFFAMEKEAAQTLFGNKTVDEWGLNELCNWIRYFCFNNSQFELGLREGLVAERTSYNVQANAFYSFEFKSKLKSFLNFSNTTDCACCSEKCPLCSAKKFLKEMKRLLWSEGEGEINALEQGSETYYILQMLDVLLGKRLMCFFNARKAVMIVACTSRVKRAEILQRFFIDEEQRKKVFSSMRTEKPSRVSIRQNVSDQYVTVSLFDKENKRLKSINDVTAVYDEGIPVDIGFIELCLLFGMKETCRIRMVLCNEIKCYKYKGRELKSNSKDEKRENRKRDDFKSLRKYLSLFK